MVEGYGLAVLTAELDDPAAYGRVVRDASGRVRRIVEKRDASPAELEIREINAGFYALSAAERWPPIAVQVGAITEDERQRWLDQLRAVQAAGGFVAGITHLFVWGTRG